MMHGLPTSAGRGYHRVPTTASNHDNGIAGPPPHHHHAMNGSSENGEHSTTDDCLQQSLLLGQDNLQTSSPSPTPPPQQTQRRQSLPHLGNWESPPQLQAGLEYAYALGTWFFPRIRRMGNLLFCITLTLMIVVVPMVTYTAIDEHRFDFAAFDSGAVMVLGTVVLSLRLVYLHLSHWYMPQVQKYVVRIVWMVPLYAVQSWLSLRFRDARIYIDAIRDVYEAFVIASFLYYLIELLGGQEALVRTLESKAITQPQLGKHSWPLNRVLQDWQLGMEFMLQCKHGVLQYVVVKTAATCLTYIFEIMGCYGEGEFRWNTAYPYLAFILNTSVMYALYVLVMLFHAVHEELQHPINWRPLGKFLCVKGVVFFTWWQSVIIYYLQSKGFIKDMGKWKADEIANALIDYCICTEMVFFAVAHSYTFSYKEYLPSSIPPELRNLTLNANINANTNASGTVSPHPLRLEPRQSSGSLGGAASVAATATASQHGLNANYCPPAVLDSRLSFKEAFWSSSIPKETLADIQRLRNGIETIVRGDSPTGCISLQEIQSEADAAMADGVASGNEAQAAAAAEVASEAAALAGGMTDDSDVEHGRRGSTGSSRRSSR